MVDVRPRHRARPRDRGGGMTRDEIIRLARKADLWLTSDERIAAVERFAALAAAAEREACAKLCEGLTGRSYEFDMGRLHSAAAIRARSQA